MSQQQPTPTPADVGAMYDQFTDLLVHALGGNIHAGYWEENEEHLPIAGATDRLTDLVAARLFGPKPPGRLLDIGCGTGRPALRIVQHHAVQVTGITISTYQIQQARKSAHDAGIGPTAGFQFADAMNLPFDDGAFDAAYAIESLVHMPDRARALAEAFRVVRPGGRLVVADILLRGTVTGNAQGAVDATALMFQISSFATADDYRQQLGAAGWELLELTDIGERVRGTYGHLSAVMRELAREAPAALADQLRGGADAVDGFAACPEVGYAFLTARRPHQHNPTAPRTPGGPP